MVRHYQGDPWGIKHANHGHFKVWFISSGGIYFNGGTPKITKVSQRLLIFDSKIHGFVVLPILVGGNVHIALISHRLESGQF